MLFILSFPSCELSISLSPISLTLSVSLCLCLPLSLPPSVSASLCLCLPLSLSPSVSVCVCLCLSRTVFLSLTFFSLSLSHYFSMFTVLSAILHIGNIKFEKVTIYTHVHVQCTDVYMYCTLYMYMLITYSTCSLPTVHAHYLQYMYIPSIVINANYNCYYCHIWGIYVFIALVCCHNKTNFWHTSNDRVQWFMYTHTQTHTE